MYRIIFLKNQGEFLSYMHTSRALLLKQLIELYSAEKSLECSLKKYNVT